MRKSPPLTLVNSSSKSNTLSPPASLNEAGAKLWRSILSEYRIEDSGGREMLAQICGAADTVAECDKIIAQDGKTIRINGGLKEHPLLKVQLAARSFIVRSLHRLGLDVEPTRDAVGRPSGTFNPTR